MTRTPAPSLSATTPAAAPLAPPLKWVGGKARLLPHIVPLYDGQRRLVEPFFGGGALAFRLAGANPGLEVVANDHLAPLMDIYRAIQTDTEALLAQVDQLAGAYLACEGKAARRAHYYAVRDAYRAAGGNDPATLLFLLRTCVSGMYRTSRRTGMFNTGHGYGDEKDGFHQPDRILAAAAAMQTWTLANGDFDRMLRHVDGDTMVFLDPPYRSTFTGYTSVGFDEHDQQRVVAFAKAAAVRGARVVYTNKETGDGFYDDAFKSWDIRRVPIRYTVNANRARTGCPVSEEVIITNQPATPRRCRPRTR